MSCNSMGPPHLNRRLRLPPVAMLLAALLAPADSSAARLAVPECDATGIPVNVEVHGLRSADGNLTVTIYGDRSEDFLAPGRKLARKRVAITGATTTACLTVPGPGGYAIAVYHDEDGDRDFGRSFVGLPAEGYGFSNDAPALVGLPSFRDARFEVPTTGGQLSIRMRY